MDTITIFSLGDFNNATELDNIYKNTSFVVYGFGNTMTHFVYSIYKGANFHYYTDSVYLKALDTVTFTINY